MMLRLWPLTIAVLASLVVHAVQGSPSLQGRSDALSLRSPFTRRQSQCVYLCTDTADVNALQIIAGCNSDDTNCFCSGFEQLSQNCLFCILQADDLDLSQVQAVCDPGAAGATLGGQYGTDSGVSGKPTGLPSSILSPSTTDSLIPQTTSIVPLNFSSCDSVCTSASDQAAGKDVLSCDNLALDLDCFCNAMSKLSRACFFCAIQVAGITESSFQTICAADLSASTGQGVSTAPSSATITGASSTTLDTLPATVSASPSASPTHSSSTTLVASLHGTIFSIAGLCVLLGVLLR